MASENAVSLCVEVRTLGGLPVNNARSALCYEVLFGI